jgi:cytochrome b
VAVAAAWFTRSRLGPLHEYLGYCAAAVASARLAWGFFGGRYARFAQFLRPARPTWAYFKQVLSRHAPRYIGHNPLGGWMVLALMSCLGALTLTGWLYTTDWLWGYGWLANLHAALGWTLLALVGLHVAGVAYTSYAHRENLVLAMFTGKKDAPQPGDRD